MVGRNWGFTPYDREDYVRWKQEGRLLSKGVHAKLYDNHGIIDDKKSHEVFATPAHIFAEPRHDESK